MGSHSPHPDDGLIKIHLLGAPRVEGSAGSDRLLAGSKRVALVAWLALAGPGKYRRRDAALPLFWPEHDQSGARNALSNLLHHVRRGLDDGAIGMRGNEEIFLDPAIVDVDVAAFDEAIADGRWNDALELYEGDFLEGFHLPDGSPAFSQWLDDERARLRTRAGEAAWSLALAAEGDGRAADARRWAEVRRRLDPWSTGVQTRVLELLGRLGDRSAAARSYRSFRDRLGEEFGIEPPEVMAELVRAIESGDTPAGGDPGPISAPGTAPPGAPEAVPAELDPTVLAIVPFEAIGGEANDPFASGLHADLLTEVGRASALTVLSRSSLDAFAATDAVPEVVARELGAGTLVQGEVQRAGERIRLHIRLTRVADGIQLWAERFDRELSTANIFDLQTELAGRIREALDAHLSPEEAPDAHTHPLPTADLEAYRLVALARDRTAERTGPTMKKGLRYLEQALERDPEYALAWAYMGLTLVALSDYFLEDRAALMTRAEGAWRRALELDPGLPDGHLAKAGWYGSETVRDAPSALAALARIENHGALAMGRFSLDSWIRLVIGEAAEALPYAERGVRVAPLDPEARVNLALAYLGTGNAAAALREAGKGLERHPRFDANRFTAALALLELGREVDALRALEELTEPWALRWPRTAQALRDHADGDEARVRAGIREQRAVGAPFHAGLLHAALGELDAAFTILEEAPLPGWDEALVWRYLHAEPMAALRDDPRYGKLIDSLDASWKVVGA